MSLLIFSIRNAFRKKSVAALAVLGVAFGCALMTFLFSISSGMEKRMERTFNEVSGQIVISGRDAIFGGMLMGMGTSTIPAGYIDVIKSVPQVEEVYGQVSIILRPERSSVIMPLYGYDSAYAQGPAGVPFKNIIMGVAPSGPDEVIIGKSLQEYMRQLDISYDVGGVYRFIVSAANDDIHVKELKVVGVYQSGNEVLDGGFCGSEELAREMGKIKVGRYSAIIAQVNDINNVEPAVQAIRNSLKGDKPLQVSVPRELLVPLKGLLKALDNFLLAVSLVAVVAGGLSISVVMLLSVIERKQEFAILKALGWKPRDVVFMILVESVFLSLLGAALGVALGYAGLTMAGKYFAIDIAAFDLRVILAVAAYGLLVGTVGGLYPAWKAERSSPAEIMRTV